MKCITKLNLCGTSMILLLSFCMLFLTSPNALLAATQKLDLKPGEIYHYKTQHKAVTNDTDTNNIRNWYDLEVVDKQDTIYTIVCTHKRSVSKDIDTRNNYYLREALRLLNMRIPFFVSTSGIVQPFEFPDSIITNRVLKKHQNDLLKAYVEIFNYKATKSALEMQFQQYFMPSPNNEKPTFEREYQTMNGISHTKYHKSNINGKSIVYSAETKFEPLDSLTQKAKSNNQPCFISNDGVSNIILGPDGMIQHLEGQTTTEGLVPYNNTEYKYTSSFSIERYTPKSYSDTFVLTAKLGNVSDHKEIKAFKFNEVLNHDILKFNLNASHESIAIHKQKLTEPVAVNLRTKGMPWALTNFLAEPGDSINVTIHEHQTIISGRGATKNIIYKKIKENSLSLDQTLSEVQAKANADKWIEDQLNDLKAYKDSISEWAYRHLQTAIYYSGHNNLLSFYFNKNNKKVNEKSFNQLIYDIKWDRYNTITSREMLSFIDSYLYRKLLIMSGATENITIPVIKKYNLVNILFKQQLRYAMLSEYTWELLTQTDITEGEKMLKDFPQEFRHLPYYNRLKRLYAQRNNLGKGAQAINFKVKDINGRNIDLKNLQGKYVQLLFINLDLNNHQKDVKAFQKMRNELPSKNFELITIFTNKEDSVTQNFLKQNKLEGILINNNNWQLESLKNYKAANSDSYFLIDPEGKIIFTGSYFSTNEFVDIFIKMIKLYIAELPKENLQQSTLSKVLLVVIAILILSGGGYIIISNRRKKQDTKRRAKLELQLSAVRAQLNPHFLFNAMSSIQYLVNQNQNEKANLFLSKFARLMRKVLFESETELISLNDELENINNYLELEALRHDFVFSIDVSPDIDTYNTELPAMLLQPFVENAVIHGIDGMKNGEITLKVEQQDVNTLRILIIDNGKGYDASNPKTTSNGKGLSLTQKRIALMIENYKNNISFNISNRSEADKNTTGTIVEIGLETDI